MRTLVLIRHAKSSWKDPSKPDFDRPLTGRGKADAPEMGRRLAKKGVTFDALVTSPAKRAKKTAVGVGEALGISKREIIEDEAIYHATVETLLGVIRRFDDDWSVVGLVGHNPGFSDLAEEVSDFGAGIMPTCAVLAVDFDIESWGQADRAGGRVSFYDYPKSREPGA